MGLVSIAERPRRPRVAPPPRECYSTTRAAEMLRSRTARRVHGRRGGTRLLQIDTSRAVGDFIRPDGFLGFPGVDVPPCPVVHQGRKKVLLHA